MLRFTLRTREEPVVLCSGEVQRGRPTEFVQSALHSTAGHAADADGARDRRRTERGDVVFTRYEAVLQLFTVKTDVYDRMSCVYESGSEINRA